MDEKEQEITKPPFEWGNFFCPLIDREVFREYLYDWYNPVKSGDIVLDIGANVGAFTYSILDKNPTHVYCLEPSKACFEVLKKNTEFSNKVTLFNKALGKKTDNLTHADAFPKQKRFFADEESIRVFEGESQTECSVISLLDFVKENDITHIDFMKFDCEGSEYSIFSDENEDYIKKNVNRASGEFHFYSEEDISSFIKFRDRYLKPAKSFKLLWTDDGGIDLTGIAFDDDGLREYFRRHINARGFCLLMVYIVWKE
jgi:FkbM family methyltransferase